MVAQSYNSRNSSVRFLGGEPQIAFGSSKRRGTLRRHRIADDFGTTMGSGAAGLPALGAANEGMRWPPRPTAALEEAQRT